MTRTISKKLTRKNLTRGQLERTLSQKLQKLYADYLNHATDQVRCTLLNGSLTIIVENALTQPEQILLEQKKKPELVEQIRSNLDDAIKPEMISLVEEILGKKVIDAMGDTTLETGRTGIIFILSED